MSHISATTPIGTFIEVIKNAIEATTSNNLITVVDKVTFQNVSNPNYQIEISSVTPISPNTSINYSILEYKVHVVVGVNKDQYADKEQRFVQSVSAMALIHEIVDGLTSLAADTNSTYTNQIFLKTDPPQFDETTKLSVCTAHFKTYLGYLTNG